ncbi:MAG: DUF58 domain-containing protein [Verrucomicrobiaceae bacterium]|nr:DUF58 domain-containing protein [Verrucomicrobiaceae bacterium]
MDAETRKLLDPRAIARAEALGMNARFIVEGYMAGEHKSPYRGFAIEFAQHREYAPGDDVRHIDWKVQAKTERFYIKQYEQETNFVAHLLLDGSESMKYGSGELSKLEYGKMMAACLAYLVLQQRDAVALGIFDEEVQEYLPRSDNRDSLFKIMDRLAGFDPQRETRIASVLHGMANQIRRKGVVIMISDFFDDEQKVIEGIQNLRFNGHEVIVMQVLDPDEIEFPFSGMVEFDGLENIARIQTRPSQIRKSYLREFEAFRERLRNACERHQCHFVDVRTDHPLDEVLSNYLAFRRSTAS